jgi:PAS domain S-box-containing protein
MTSQEHSNNSDLTPSLEVADLFTGSGEMKALMRAKAWAETPLGSPDTWPQSLKTVVQILLSSRFAMWMGWGRDLTFFYNDAYRPTLGIKDEWALGASTRQVWREIWPDIGPRINHVLATGEATWDEGLLLFLERRGYPEETYHTFSYSPLADDDGAIVGMLCVVTEETERIIEERRLSCLNGLASDIARTNTRTELVDAVARQLGAASRDLPFALTYLFDEEGKAKLACASGVNPGHPVAPSVIDPACTDLAWPVDELVATRTMLTVGGLDQRFDQLPTGAWDTAAREAVIAPITRQGQDVLAGFLVAAVNPYRSLNETYFRFINLVAGQLAAGLANADAHEEARRRAEALAEIDRAKTAFFSNVSHEFRTPLTLMLGPLEELMAGAIRRDSNATQELLGTAHRNAMRLLKLVNSLLDFSRIEAGRLKANYEPIDLAALTAELASSFRSALEKARLRLILDCSKLPEPVYVDRDMWEKIVLNLLSNAFKFTFKGEIEVAIRSTVDGKAAQLVVRDTGTGIAHDELPRLFERFHRIEGARGRTFEGSGIGLSLVQELAKLHGATIHVESEVGRGSTFIVTVPFGTGHLLDERIGNRPNGTWDGTGAQANVEEALRWLPDQEGTQSTTTGLPSRSNPDDLGATALPHAAVKGGRVLLADDNADMREYVTRLLVEQGYLVEAVTDGEAALAAVRRRPPDLVLSDIMMPRLDGFGLVRAMRNDPALRTVPIVLLSARAGDEARVAGVEEGADDYLTKPFAARELLARVGSNIRMARMRSEAADARRARTNELETVLATVPAAVWFTNDPDGRHIFGNRQAAAWMGLPDKDKISLVGPATEVDRPSNRVVRAGVEVTPDELPIRRAIRGEEVHDDELELVFEDGTSLTMLANSTAFRDPSGLIVGAVCAAIDISSLKRLEERCRRVVESSPAAMVMIRATGVIEMVNVQVERIFGYSRWELLGRPIEVLLPERYRGHHAGLRTEFFAAPVARQMGEGRDLYGRKKDGSEFPIEIGLSPIETDDGTMVLSAIVDLSERAAATRSRVQAEAEFRASFEAAAVGSLVADPLSRRILRANRAFARMLGYDPEELVGRTCPEFTWHEDVALDAVDFERLLAGEDQAIVREMRYLRRDGTPFWVRTSASIAHAAGTGGRGIVVRASRISTRGIGPRPR